MGAECYPPQPIATMNTVAKQSGHAVFYIISSKSGQMSQPVKVLATKSDDLSFVSETHLMERGRTDLWPDGHMCCMIHAYTT